MSADKSNFLLKLSPQQRQGVVNLLARLQEETESHNKYKALYERSQHQLNDLLLKYNKLKDENSYLKQQMHSSFSLISQVRANFQAKKQKLLKNKDQVGDWQDQSESAEDDENQFNSSNNNLNIPFPKSNKRGSLQKYRPQQISAGKSPSVLNISSNFLNQTHLASSKSKELDQLRRQVKMLQMEKIKQQEKAKQLTQKHRLVDEIKNRYRSQKEDGSREKQGRGGSAKERDGSVERIDITDTFDNQEQTVKNKYPVNKGKTSQTKEKPNKNQVIREKREVKESTMQQVNQKQNHQSKPNIARRQEQQDYGDVLDMIDDYNL